MEAPLQISLAGIQPPEEMAPEPSAFSPIQTAFVEKLRAHDPHLWDLGYEQHSQDIVSISADSVHNDSDGDR